MFFEYSLHVGKLAPALVDEDQEQSETEGKEGEVYVHGHGKANEMHSPVREEGCAISATAFEFRAGRHDPMMDPAQASIPFAPGSFSPLSAGRGHSIVAVWWPGVRVLLLSIGWVNPISVLYVATASLKIAGRSEKPWRLLKMYPMQRILGMKRAHLEWSCDSLRSRG